MKKAFALIIICLFMACSEKKANQKGDTSSIQNPAANDIESTQNEEEEIYDVSETEGNDCIFDVEYQTDDFLKGIEEFQNYTWNDSTKTATIMTEDQDTLFITRGGCNHFELAIRLITQEKAETMDTTFWLNKAKWYASKVYIEHDYNMLDSLIENSIYTVYSQEGNLQVIFEGDHNFSEFYAYISPKENATQMELVYYFD